MKLKGILAQLNILGQCKKYRLSAWQCPQFLFLVMGTIIIIAMLSFYFIGTHYIEDPIQVAFITTLMAIILIIISTIISQSFERLAEASRMKSEFVSVVSHQLRSPLSNLKWVVELLLSEKIEPDSDKQHEYFTVLKENNQRMLDLVSDLLMVSRIDEGRVPLKKEEVFPVELVNKVISDFKTIIKASNTEIIFEPESNLPKVSSDSFQLRQVLGNLIDNGIRYVIPKGRIEVAVKKMGGNLRFEVTDNGVGIPAEDQKYIFQKFFRARNVLKYQTQGTGLGLYIAKSIVQRLGGKMDFQSEEGKGTTFWFTIPIK